MIQSLSTMRATDCTSHREDNVKDNFNMNATTTTINHTNNNTNNTKQKNINTSSHPGGPTRSNTPKYTTTQLHSKQQCAQRQQNFNDAISRINTTRKYKKAQLTTKDGPYEGDKWYGDVLPTHNNWETGDYSETIRICSININGISKDLNWIEWDTTLKSMYSLQVDILGITEPNINFKNKRVKSTIIDMSKSFERNVQISTSCSNQMLTTTKKKGGTMTVISGRWAGRKHDMGEDNKGRWSSVTLQGKKDKLVTFITAYRVCQQKGGVGCTIHHQQQLDFEIEGKRMVNLRQQFCQDLTKHIRFLHDHNHTVVLMGDFNEDCSLSGNQIDNMLRESCLINVMKVQHGDDCVMPNTYDRGKKCIDLIAITDDPTINMEMITKAGFMPFYHEFCSDHRALYCDINTKCLFGAINKDNMNSSNRPFTTSNIKQCEKFKTKVRQLYTKAKIFKKVKDLKTQLNTNNADDRLKIIEECKSIGIVTSQLLINAGKCVGKKKYTHGRPFSGHLDQIARKYRKEKNKLRILKERRQQISTQAEEERMILRVKKTYRELRLIQRQAHDLRQKFLMEIADKRAYEWKLSQQSALNIIIQAEASKKTFARHGAVMKAGEKGSIKSLMVPIPEYRDTLSETKEVEWTEIEDENTIYRMLLKKNAQQLMRSAESPFAHGSIVEGCGYDGDGPLTQKILDDALDNNEKYNLLNDYPDLRDELDTFITALAKPKDSNGIPINDFSWSYGVKEFRRTFRRTRESTACGPSGLNMSFWKALAEDDDLAEVHAFLIEVAFRLGFSYKRWKLSWHCMLKKDKKPFLHRLRIIQLFEGDFNGALKYLLGRLLMHHVVKTNQCDKQAFGSIPGRTAHDALITLQLSYDYARVRKQTMASLFNDAAGCYDRIRSLLSYLCMVRVGCPHGIAKCHSLTQREMVHHVKTSRGPSINNIRWGPHQSTTTIVQNGIHSTVGNIGGIGQGGGASPIGWLAVLLVMIQTYSKYTSGITLTDPMGMFSLALYLISYVDDNTLVQRFEHDQGMPSILEQLQFCLKKWHNILKITGGDLALEKCTFCILKWRWKGSKATLETITSAPGVLTVDNTEIQRLEPDRGTRVLGVRMAMNGSFSDELLYRRQQSKTMAGKLYKSGLSHTDAYMVYATRFSPAAEYPLKVTTFSKREMESIQKPFIHLLLPKLGLNRHTPLAVIHGPMFRGGLGITPLEEIQIVKHFTSFQSHMRRNDNIGKGLQIQLMVQQLEIGCGKLFLNTNPNDYPYATKRTRLGYLWQQCFRFSITVSLQQDWSLAGSEGNSDTIMDHIVLLFPLSHKKRIPLLQRINACRIYLKVVWVSDLLLDPDDTVMDVELIRGNKVNTGSPLQFPYQGKPTRADFELWKDCVYRCFCKLCPHPYQDGQTLVRSIFGPTQRVNNNFSDKSDYIDIVHAISKHSSLSDKFAHLPPRFRDLIGDIQLPSDDGLRLLSSLKSGTAALASDGSYYEDINKGTHAYALVCTDSDLGQIKGAATSPHSDHMSSAPTEHYGALAVLTILIVLLYHHNEDGLGWPSVPLYIDNEEIVDRGNSNPKFRNVQQYLAHDYDLWVTTRVLQKSLQLKVAFEWIRGHQIAEEQKDNVLAVLLNIEVDAMATAQYKKEETPPHRGAFHSGVVCFHQKGFHVQKVTNAIMSRESDSSIIDYYLAHGWDEESLLLVDWTNLEKFMKRRHPIERCNIIQLMHDWQNTGYQQIQFQHKNSQKVLTDNVLGHATKTDENLGACVFECGKMETPFHYMHCTSDILMTARSNGKDKLDKELDSMNTAPSLREAILHGIHCWEDDTEYELTEESHRYLFDEAHTRLLRNQEKIGWEKFLKGYITKEWGYIQESYYNSTKIQRKRKHTKNNWVQHLLRSLHIYRQSIWNIRNQTVHGGSTKAQKELSRKKLLKLVVKYYRKDRSAIPIREQNIFHLPLQLRKKQGTQQLSLWLQRAKLLFETYIEVPLRVDQQQHITTWLQDWNAITNEVRIPHLTESIDSSVCSSAEDDDNEVRNQFSQMNITNWLKSWGREEMEINNVCDSNSDDLKKQVIPRSIRDGLLNEQLS
jgi:hypothetical protein